MSKRKDVIRVGDRVKIITPNVVVRVGYPLTKAEMMDRQTPEQLKAIRDMMRAFDTIVYPEHASEFGLVSSRGSSEAIDKLYEKIRYAMAGRMLEQEGFGGKERSIHTYNLKAIQGRLATVDAKRIVKTGTYQAGWSTRDYWGEYDYEPACLSNGNTHVLYKLCVDGFGTWWSEMRDADAFSVNRKDDYKDIEIEKCNLVKIDPKASAHDDEHPSGLSGEHSVVLDAIHQVCLHGR